MKLKDLVNLEFIKKLSTEIKAHHSLFDAQSFLNSVGDKKWKSLELKERIRKLTHETHRHMGSDFVNNIRVLRKVSHKLHKDKVNALCLLYFPDYVQVYGLEHWDESMKALEHLTQHSTSEFAVRAFFQKDFSKMLKQMLKWAEHKNYHVRRFSTEGSRPRLPWGLAVKELNENLYTLDILEKLKNDPELYVRKSVANHLNDISKKFPEDALRFGSKWYGKNENQNWVVKHAFRGLLKKGDANALKIFGFKAADPKSLKVSNFKAPIKVNMGEDLKFNFTLNSKKVQNLRLEFAIYFLRTREKYTRKVFLVSEKEFLAGIYNVQKKYSFKKISTRKYYNGKHFLSLIVNGTEVEKKSFILDD